MSVPNRGPELQAVCYTLAVSSVIAVALRIYVRVRLVKNFGLDDWFMCSALVLPYDDIFKDLNWLPTPPNHDTKTRCMDPLWRHGHNCLHRSRLLLRHSLPMLANLVLLEPRSIWKMRQA
ncbi:hypothetical protein LB505_002457 [Fusarium chuoi]|nr:hypothetical protein LB505_002457 [Fusarium chuoi]